jgi:hypothetical protein
LIDLKKNYIGSKVQTQILSLSNAICHYSNKLNIFSNKCIFFSTRKRRDEEIVCYGDLGCFYDDGPFNYLDMLPASPELIGTQLFLFTRKNPKQPQNLIYNNMTTVKESNFNVSASTKIIIHGFGSSCFRVWTTEMRLKFLNVVRKIFCLLFWIV